MPIYQEQGKWYIEDVKGSHDTYDKALTRLRAVKAEQARRKKKVYIPYKKGRKRGGQHYTIKA